MAIMAISEDGQYDMHDYKIIKKITRQSTKKTKPATKTILNYLSYGMFKIE